MTETAPATPRRKHGLRRGEDTERAIRRQKVTALLLGGVTNHTLIAQQIGCDRTTISKDVKALDQQFRDRAAEEITKARGLDLNRTDRLIQAVWGKAIQGNYQAVDRVLSLMQHRSRLLGLDTPVKQDVTMNHIIREYVGIDPDNFDMLDDGNTISVEGMVVPEDDD